MKSETMNLYVLYPSLKVSDADLTFLLLQTNCLCISEGLFLEAKENDDP